MRIISRRRLREFLQGRKHDADNAERDLSAWYKSVRTNEWENFGQLRQTFGSADRVGNCTVFDVGNNRYRLIARVNFEKGIVYVLKVMDHAEYDRQDWEDPCGCHKPPPKTAARVKQPPPGARADRQRGKRRK